MKTSEEIQYNYFIIIVLLIGICWISFGCMPDKIAVKHDGNITTTNVIRIEIALPPSLSDAFTTSCTGKCSNQTCIDQCTADQTTNYTNQILNLIGQLNSTLVPPKPAGQ
jgi:hypothetical protein